MREQLKPGENPRLVLGGHQERGPERFEYTRHDLAELYGVSMRTLHRWTGSGRLDPADLTSICEVWHERVRHDPAPRT